MLWVIFILVLLDLIFTMGLVGAISDLSKRPVFPANEPSKFIKTPVKKPKVKNDKSNR